MNQCKGNVSACKLSTIEPIEAPIISRIVLASSVGNRLKNCSDIEVSVVNVYSTTTLQSTVNNSCIGFSLRKIT